MADIIDITGLKFGKLTALEPFGRIRGVLTWYCVCDCGMYCFVKGVSLRRLDRSSCRLYGCKPDTTSCVEFDESKTMQRKARKAVDSRHKKKHRFPREDNSHVGATSILIDRRQKYMSSLRAGDVIRYRSNADIIGGYLLAEVIKIFDDSLWIKNRMGERRIRKNLVIYYTDVEKLNHEHAQQSV